MSGHYATLLRGTVAAFLDTPQVFITDWADAKDVPLSESLTQKDGPDFRILRPVWSASGYGR